MAIAQMTYIDSELELASLETARFSWAGGDYRGRPLLTSDLPEHLLALEDEHDEARQQLYLARPQTIDWSSPVLYSRLADGRLWIPRAEPQETAKPITQTRPRRRMPLHRLRPLQWLTALLAPALFLLGLWPAARSELHLDLHATRIAVWLAQCVTAIDELNLVEIGAAPLDASPLPLPFQLSTPSDQTRHRKKTVFLVAPHNVGSRVPIDIPPLPANTQVALNDSTESTDRFTVDDSAQEIRAPSLDTAGPFRLNHTESVVPVFGDIAQETDVSTDPPPIQRADLYQDTERPEHLVARIIAKNIEGAGILFAVDDRFVYGVTAKHVLFQQGKIAEGLEVELRAWPGRRLPIVGYKLHLDEDVAAFWINLSPLGLSHQQILQGIPLNQLGASTKLDPGDALHSLGHSTAGAWISPKDPVRFARTDGDNGFLFEYSCPPGHSGGAVFDEQWRLVGMIIEEERPFCRALRIEPILAILRAWKLSIGLSTPLPRTLEKAATQQITVAVVGFDNRSKDLPNLGPLAQAVTTSYLQTLPGIVLIGAGRPLQADALVTGSIVRYDIDRQTFSEYGTKALKDNFRMSINLQILNAKTSRVQYSKNFDVERIKQYPKATSAPDKPVDLTNELLEDLLTQARSDLRSALSQLAGGLETAGQFIDVPVSSTPDGADVILNGIYMGKTPITLQLASEILEIKVELTGYEAWNRRVKVQPGKSIEVTLVPQSAPREAFTGSIARGAGGYEVSLVPSARLSEIRLTVSRLDAQGKTVAVLSKNEELGYGYYPSNTPTVFSTGKLGPAGFYRLSITAVPKSGLSVEQDIEIYHPGD